MANRDIEDEQAMAEMEAFIDMMDREADRYEE
jgi:hypothetical protein